MNNLGRSLVVRAARALLRSALWSLFVMLCVLALVPGRLFLYPGMLFLTWLAPEKTATQISRNFPHLFATNWLLYALVLAPIIVAADSRPQR